MPRRVQRALVLWRIHSASRRSWRACAAPRNGQRGRRSRSGIECGRIGKLPAKRVAGTDKLGSRLHGCPRRDKGIYSEKGHPWTRKGIHLVGRHSALDALSARNKGPGCADRCAKCLHAVVAAAFAGQAAHEGGDRRFSRKSVPGKDPVAQDAAMAAMQALDADHACGARTGLPDRACGHGQLETQHLREIRPSSGYADSRFVVPARHKVGYPPISGTVFKA
jgi:hypothetical protein